MRPMFGVPCFTIWCPCPVFHHLVSTVWYFSLHSTISVVAPNKVTSWWERLLGMCLVSTIWCFGVQQWWLLLITSATSAGQNKHWTHHVFYSPSSLNTLPWHFTNCRTLHSAHSLLLNREHTWAPVERCLLCSGPDERHSKPWRIFTDLLPD